jgi:hypothetical protein
MIMEHTYLAHHGTLGQKWGIRKYQNADGSLTPAGRLRYLKNNISDKIKLKNTYDTKLTSGIKTSFGKTRYTNIDGSLNERGKKMVSNFAKNEIERNNKYYDRHIDKYKKAYESTNSELLKKRYKSMIDDAEKSREKLNDNIGKLSVDDIVSIKNDRNMKKLKIAGAITGTAGVAGALAYTEGDPHKLIDDAMEFSRTNAAGKKLRTFVDGSLRTAIDGKAYVTAIFADQTITRAQEFGTFDKINAELSRSGDTLAGSMKKVLSSAEDSSGRIAKSITDEVAKNGNVADSILRNKNTINMGKMAVRQYL